MDASRKYHSRLKRENLTFLRFGSQLVDFIYQSTTDPSTVLSDDNADGLHAPFAAKSIKTTYLESREFRIRELGPGTKNVYIFLENREKLRTERGVDLKLRITSSNPHHSRV